ncbi:hypothetical protein T09_10244 [Trichinella sp. T9]|nr:hypothetical protein T09_10244 [Trichinella sp. T9]
MARRNSKYLGYTTGEVARPAVRKLVGDKLKLVVLQSGTQQGQKLS